MDGPPYREAMSSLWDLPRRDLLMRAAIALALAGFVVGVAGTVDSWRRGGPYLPSLPLIAVALAVPCSLWWQLSFGNWGRWHRGGTGDHYRSVLGPLPARLWLAFAVVILAVAANLILALDLRPETAAGWPPWLAGMVPFVCALSSMFGYGLWLEWRRTHPAPADPAVWTQA